MPLSAPLASPTPMVGVWLIIRLGVLVGAVASAIAERRLGYARLQPTNARGQDPENNLWNREAERLGS